MSGKVTLVGAGPGEKGLLTIKGLEAIKNAQVVVYDKLVGEDILRLIPENAEMIDVGKESGYHKIPQEEINKILLDKAVQGKDVVRLKGGDCFLFGRGGEELELLYKNNIEFQVIPGITSALSVPAYGGIPVTHRDFVSSVHIITGHRRKGESLGINFKSCVECGGTLVFLMGVSNLENIMNGLRENGMRADMPCAVIENGTRAVQRKVTGTVGTIKKLCDERKIHSPSIIIVGEVCTLSSSFDWYERLPLKGIKIAVTRPKERAGTLSEKLRNLGAQVIDFPCIETVSILDDFDVVKDKIKRFKWIVFTSPAGVKTVFDKMAEKKIDGRIFADRKIAVIGSATGRELEKYGMYADLMPKVYDGKNLAAALIKNAINENILLLRAEKGSKELTDILRESNVEFEDLPVYRTVYNAVANDISKMNDVDYVTFTSASTVKAFTQVIKTGYERFTGLCIGEKTKNEAEKYGIRTIVSEKAEIDGMISVLIKEVGKCPMKY